MGKMILQQKCPMCAEMLDYEVLSNNCDGVDDDGNVTFTLEAQTTPESTAHVWTHAPEGTD